MSYTFMGGVTFQLVDRRVRLFDYGISETFRTLGAIASEQRKKKEILQCWTNSDILKDVSRFIAPRWKSDLAYVIS